MSTPAPNPVLGNWTPTDLGLLALAGGLGVGAVLWAGAALAALGSGYPTPGFAPLTALLALGAPTDPASVWPTPNRMPGPVAYWAGTAVHSRRGRRRPRCGSSAAWHRQPGQRGAAAAPAPWTGPPRPGRRRRRHPGPGRAAPRSSARTWPAQQRHRSGYRVGRVSGQPAVVLGRGLDPAGRPTADGQGPARGHPVDPRRPRPGGGHLDPPRHPRRHHGQPAPNGPGGGVRPAAPRRAARRAALVPGPRLRDPADRARPRPRPGRRRRVRQRRVATADFWAGQTETALRCLLHAAALDGRGALDLYRWSLNPGLAEDADHHPDTHPDAADGWADALDAIVHADPRTRDSVWLGVRQALAALGRPRRPGRRRPRTRHAVRPRARS